MGTVDNEKLGPVFTRTYGKKTVFKYGCEPGNFDIFVYRITMTNEDGTSIDYPFTEVIKRCEQLGVKHVPVLFMGNAKEFTKAMDSDDFGMKMIEAMNAAVIGSSTIDLAHIREGVVLKVEGIRVPAAYKHKSFEFKVLEGILKPEDVPAEVEMEEL
jgi:hypothetical protein